MIVKEESNKRGRIRKESGETRYERVTTAHVKEGQEDWRKEAKYKKKMIKKKRRKGRWQR